MIKNGGHQTAFWIAAKQSLPWSLLLPWEPGMSENSQPMLAKPFWDTLKRRSRIVRELFPDHGHSWRRYTQPISNRVEVVCCFLTQTELYTVFRVSICAATIAFVQLNSTATWRRSWRFFFSAKLVDQDNGKNGQKKAKSPENTDKNLKTWCT